MLTRSLIARACVCSTYCFSVIVAAIALLTSIPSSNAALVAYWNFDETTGTNVFDLAGNTTRTNNGFFATGAETPARVAGRLGNAVGFTWQTPNVTGTGRRVIVPYHTNLTLNGPYTISYWYRMDAATPAGTFPGIMRIGSQSTTTGNNVGWGFFRTGNMVFKRGNNQPGIFGAMNVGQWYHLAIRWDGTTSGTNTLAYLNGVRVGFAAVGGWSNVTATTIFEMGRMDQFDQATLDDLALWGNEAVAPAKIRSIYTVPTSLFLDYDLADMRTLWGVFDSAGSSNAVVDGNTWSYAPTLPGSTNDGDAYRIGGTLYVALGGGAGVSAPITVVSGRFSPDGIGIAGTLAPASSFTVTNANFVFDLNTDPTPGGTTNDLLDVTGDLTLANSTVTINPLSPLLGGTYRLINYSGAKNGSLSLSNTTRYSIALDESVANQINAVITGTNGTLKWTSTASGAWDLTSSNWLNLDSTSTDTFFQGDAVLFDDSAAYTTNISVNTAVFPRSITVNSATRPYIFTGVEQIGGMSGGLIKDGASSLTLSTPNTFNSDVMVNAGTLRVGNAAALGTTNGQTIIAAGATLDLGGVNPGLESVTVQGSGVNNAGAVVNTGGALSGTGLRGRITLAGDTTFGGTARWDPINGTMIGNGFKLTKVGTPEIAMTGLGNTGLGEIDIVQGTLTFQGSTRPGDPALPITVSNNAALAFWAVGAAPFNKPVQMRQNSIMRNNTSGGTDVATNLGVITLLGDATFETSANIALLSEVTGPGALLKTGAGTLYLGGTNTYTGRTSVGAGRVVLLDTGSINGSPRIDLAATLDTSRIPGGYPLAAGQALAGSGTVAGSLVAPSNSAIYAGGQNFPGTLRLTNGLRLSGGVLTFELNAAITEGAGGNDLITVGGNLDLADVSRININPLALLTSGNTYTLISYTGALSGSVANLVVDNTTRYTFTLSDATPNKITITVTGGNAAELSWLGGTLGAERLWDVQTTPNWSDVLGSAVFFGGDQVIFDDLAAESTVELVGTLTPSTIRVENTGADQSGLDYTFEGTGKLSGSSSLTKKFGGKLTIANSNVNDNIGPTSIEAGTVQVGIGGPWGNLGSGPITNNGALIYSRSDTVTFTNRLEGSGSLSKLQTNLMVFSFNNSNYSGPITATGGVVRATITNGFGNDIGATTIGSGATLEINGQNLGAEPVTVSGAGFGGNGAVVNTGTATNNALRFLTLAGDTTVGGTTRWDVRAAPSAQLNTGGNGHSLTKVGVNQVSVVDASVDPALGDINVQAGMLSFELSSQAGDSSKTVTVASNATFQLWGRTTPWQKRGVFNGGRNLLNAGTGAADWIGPITINNTVLIESAGTALTITDPITGPGSLVKTGAVVLVLAGDNTYAGDTTNVAGTLQLGGGAASGSVLSSIIQNNGNLSVFRSDAYTLTNRINGAGSIHVRTPAGLTLELPAALGGNLSVGNLSYGLLITPPSFNATVGNYFLGDSSGVNGDAVQLGGTVTVTAQMRVGHWPSAATSTFTMGGGTLSLTAIPAGVPNPVSGEVNGILYLGIDGTGIFYQTGGVASAHGIVLDGRGNTTAGGDGIDRFILNGGRFNVGPSGIRSGSLDANTSISIQLGGGTLASSANWSSALPVTLTGFNGRTTFDSGSNSNAFTNAITGFGGLIKTGPGTLALTGINPYEGGTVVNQGVLLVRGSLGAGLGTVGVESGGTLNGDGTINDEIVVSAGGTLAVGSGIAKLQVNDAVTFNGGTTLLDISKSGTLTNDQISAQVFIYGGTLTVAATGSALAPGDTFKLFDAPSYSGAFTTLNLPTLTSNYVWNVSNLAVDGTISVTQPAPRIVFVRAGNSIELTWSNQFSDYILQAQTNALTVGIQTTNWFDVTNGTNAATITIDPNNPSVFYRLIKP